MLVSALASLAAVLLIMQLPVTNSILGQRMYEGIHNSQIRSLAQAISSNIHLGDSVVCMNPSYQIEPMSELRLLSYACSRWAAAYGDSDGVPKNQWRKAVLGQIPSDQLREVQTLQLKSTTVIAVGPVADFKLSPDWNLLIDPAWSVVAGTG